ncbi:hypothetical protein K501DRAFT_338917 [Backusella circina FSU 941]|nr:hypothetical protein K501DRAFT_338917 [Backusella circina FSU 941]
MELEESDASFWEYLGEGNLNIVIRYQGTDDIYKGKVLRIAKEDDSISKRDSSIPFTQQFSQNIITPLLGSEYVLSVTPIQVTPAFLRAIAHHIEADRPNPRKQKSIDFSLSVAYLMKDIIHRKDFHSTYRRGISDVVVTTTVTGSTIITGNT